MENGVIAVNDSIDFDNRFLSNIVNGSSEYDNRWFMARPQARVAFETLFDSAAQPYIALMRASGQITFADPVTLEDVAVIEAFEYERPLSGFVDSADVDTFYMEAEQAGFTETYRVNLATGTVCLMWLQPVLVPGLRSDRRCVRCRPTTAPCLPSRRRFRVRLR